MSEAVLSRTGVVRMTPTELVFKAELLVAEVAAELLRDRHKYTEDDAAQRARHLVGRICRHCDWPQGVYLYDSDDERDLSVVGGAVNRANLKAST